MASSVILRNLSQLEKSLQQNINYVDIDYRGPRDGYGTVLTKGSPLLNEYKIWLQSSKTDYIRDYGKGGFFAYNLNEYEFSSASEEKIEQDLIAATKAQFPSINIIACEVKCMSPKRYWKVKVVVSDKMTGLIGADMVKDGESIVFNVDKISTN